MCARVKYHGDVPIVTYYNLHFSSLSVQGSTFSEKAPINFTVSCA